MKKTMTAKWALALILCSGASAAYAQNVIEEGVSFKPVVNTVYEFTPSIDGNLTITVNSYANFMYMQNWDYLLYSSASHSEQSGIPNSGYNEIASNITDYHYQNIEAGKTYYFYTDIYAGVDCTFTMKEFAGEGIAKVFPSTIDPFNYVVQQEVQISGTSAITSMGNATITYGSTVVNLDKEKYVVELNGGGNNIFIQIKGPEFQQLVAQIANTGAQSFTITVDGVEAGGQKVVDNASGEEGVKVENGTVSVTYDVFPAAQYLTANSTWPTPFYSSWQKGDPKGMATLEFDQEIKSVGSITLMMGNFTPGMITDMDSYEIETYTVEGKKVIIDFTGVSRLSTRIKQVTVIVQNVVGKNGVSANLGDNPLNLESTLFQYITYSSDVAPENPDIPEVPDVPDTPEGPQYMEKRATQVNDEVTLSDSAIELTWPETVKIIDADKIEIPVNFGGKVIGNLTSDYINLVKSGSSEPGVPATRVETGETGTTMFLLLGSAGLLQDPGIYTLTLPEGMVENAAGEINKQQLIAVEYVAPVEGEVTPEAGTTFESGEDIIITITFDGNVVEANYTPDAPVLVTNYADYDEQLNWTPNVLYIEGNAIVINLGTELEAGTYSLSLREGVVLVDGVKNASIDDYIFIVAEDETGAIESIGVENGAKEIYNLNGVKVNENNLAKGVYIINGKKVVVK